MVYNPLDQEQIYDRLQERVVGQTEKLTNFNEGTLNYVLTHDGYAGYFSRFEHALLAVQLSGWIETAGGPIEEDDLVRLEIDEDRVDLDLLNSYMHDGDLDELAIQNGVHRDPGDHAEGEVTFLTVDENVEIPSGVVVTTDEDARGSIKEYITTEETEAETGTTRATAPVEALYIGPEYNTGPGSIENIISPPSGVRDVINEEPINGGEPPETNAELRERAKQAVTQQTGGGTENGIIGGLVEMIEGLDEDNIYIEEFVDSDPPYVEVTVDGGEDRLVRDAIDHLKPTGIRHNLIRPAEYLLEVDITISGGPVNVDRVESEIIRVISDVGLGEDVNRAAIIQAVMNADNDIQNIESLVLRTDEHGEITGDFELDPDEKVEPGTITVEV